MKFSDQVGVIQHRPLTSSINRSSLVPMLKEIKTSKKCCNDDKILHKEIEIEEEKSNKKILKRYISNSFSGNAINFLKAYSNRSALKISRLNLFEIGSINDLISRDMFETNFLSTKKLIRPAEKRRYNPISRTSLYSNSRNFSSISCIFKEVSIIDLNIPAVNLHSQQPLKFQYSSNQNVRNKSQKIICKNK